MALLVKSIADMICEQGNEVVDDVIAGFSYRYNEEIDNYLRNRAVDFTRKSMTMTHLVFETGTGLAENGFALFGSRDDVENGKPITYDQLFLFLR